jgi:hypothetical protein
MFEYRIINFLAPHQKMLCYFIPEIMKSQIMKFQYEIKELYQIVQIIIRQVLDFRKVKNKNYFSCAKRIFQRLE